MTTLVIACADLPAPQSTTDMVTVLGGTEQLVILQRGGERFACRRETGELVTVPESFVALASPDTIEVAGVRVALRADRPAVLRGVERLRVALDLGDRGQAVLVPGLGAFALVLATSSGNAQWLAPTVICATGKLVSPSTLPVWVINQRDKYDLETAIPWTITYEPTARAVVVSTPERASWIIVESLAELVAAREHSVEFVVARAPQYPAVIDYFAAKRELVYRDGADTLAATAFTPAVAQRIARLRALGVVPALDDDTAEEFAADVARTFTIAPTADSERAASRPPVIAGSIIATHLAATPGPDHIGGPASPATAARANAALASSADPRRFYSFESRELRAHESSELTFIRISPDTRAAIASEHLLSLDPDPPPFPTDTIGALVELAALKPTSIAATPNGDRVHIRLELDAALDLVALLPKR